VTAHSAPLREQGSWAERFIVPAQDCARLPADVSFEMGAALPVPALTADQVVSDALKAAAGHTVLVHGAGGVTGGMLVQLAAHHGATVIATAGPRSAGRLATITADLPAAERDLTMTAVQVVPDGARLGELARLAARGGLSIASIRSYSLEQAGEALVLARHGASGAALVLRRRGSGRVRGPAGDHPRRSCHCDRPRRRCRFRAEPGRGDLHNLCGRPARGGDIRRRRRHRHGRRRGP
jgi:Zn-dependent alcohol dehydrogenase